MRKAIILDEPPKFWKELMKRLDKKFVKNGTFKPKANHDSLLDGTEFCGNCGKIKKYGHKTAFRTQLDCRCKIGD